MDVVLIAARHWPYRASRSTGHDQKRAAKHKISIKEGPNFVCIIYSEAHESFRIFLGLISDLLRRIMSLHCCWPVELRLGFAATWYGGTPTSRHRNYFLKQPILEYLSLQHNIPIKRKPKTLHWLYSDVHDVWALGLDTGRMHPPGFRFPFISCFYIVPSTSGNFLTFYNYFSTFKESYFRVLYGITKLIFLISAPWSIQMKPIHVLMDTPSLKDYNERWGLSFLYWRVWCAYYGKYVSMVELWCSLCRGGDASSPKALVDWGFMSWISTESRLPLKSHTLGWSCQKHSRNDWCYDILCRALVTEVRSKALACLLLYEKPSSNGNGNGNKIIESIQFLRIIISHHNHSHDPQSLIATYWQKHRQNI